MPLSTDSNPTKIKKKFFYKLTARFFFLKKLTARIETACDNFFYKLTASIETACDSLHKTLALSEAKLN
jgi:hypothetical protein